MIRILLRDKALPAALIGVGAGLLGYLLQAPLGRAVGLGATAAAVALVFLATSGLVGLPRRPVPPATAPRRDTAPRWEIDKFDQLHRRSPHLAESTRERLVALLDARLRAQGSSFERARADGSLGPGPWELLAEPAQRLPSRAQLTALVGALDRVLPRESLDRPEPPQRQGVSRP